MVKKAKLTPVSQPETPVAGPASLPHPCAGQEGQRSAADAITFARASESLPSRKDSASSFESYLLLNSLVRLTMKE
jgi:hypothetical protein